MAGIGFELKRVLQRGGLLRFLGVSLAGTAIVAGPWLLSVLGIFLIQRYAGRVLTEAPTLFSAAIVYCYAISLIIASGVHYVFTRQISDLIYEDKNREAGSALLSFLLVTIAVSAAIAAAGILPLRLEGAIAEPRLFMVSLGVLFIAINANWVLMCFISLLKSYAGIFLVYVGGSLISFVGVLVLGGLYATGGALLGYAFGQCFAFIVLYAMTLGRFRPARLSLKGLAVYFGRYRFLFLAGLLYSWATWADKVVFWFAFGKRIEGSWFHIFDPYDVPIFFAILTLIPSLIYFTIETETAFYPRLREFLRCVGAEPWHRIQEKKRAMIASLGAGLREQSILQAIVSATLIILAPYLGRALFGEGVNVTALRTTLAAVFFHSLFLSLMIFLFYLELYGRAFVSTLAFFGVNLAASAATAYLGNVDLLGGSYLLGGVGGCVVAGIFLSRSIQRIDRTLFIRAAGA
jgi:uncharacterized membrane protein